jgi:hypothetical protein
MRGTQSFGFARDREPAERPFGFTQDRESFDLGQDLELVERHVERQMDVFQQPVRFSRDRAVLSLAVLI